MGELRPGTGVGRVDGRRGGVVFLQFGNYAETVRRFARGGDETYYAQRYSVDFVEELPKKYGPTTVMTVGLPESYEILPSGVRCLNTPTIPFNDAAAKPALAKLREIGPGAVVVRFPSLPVIRWCLREGIRVFPLLADSFRGRSLKNRFDSWRLSRALNDRRVEFAANHQLDSCRDLARIGVSPTKILPWDWPAARGPSDHEAKAGPAVAGALTVAFAGSVCEDKGVGDLIAAVADLNEQGLPTSATIAGGGDLDAFRAQAAGRGVADRVEFKGLIPHREVAEIMRRSDVVVVPSRHAYGEGLPMAIIDGLTSRSPLVISDHPMFVARLRDDPAVSIFPERDAAALARRLRNLAEDGRLYRSHSEHSRATWERLQIPLKWGEMVGRWLSGTPDDLAWLSRFSLAARNDP